MNYTKIESIDHLKKLTRDNLCEFFIWLNGLRSSKDIEWQSEERLFYVNHQIDDTEELYNEEELEESNIGIAIKNNRFYKY